MNVNSSGDYPIGGNGSINQPFRSMANAGTFAYGCPPIDDPPSLPWMPPLEPQQYFHPQGCQCLSCKFKTVTAAFTVCAKCNRHVRTEEPCPWCMSSDIRKLLDICQSGAIPNAAVHAQLAQTRAVLRKAIKTLRALSQASNGAFDPLIAECEKAL